MNRRWRIAVEVLLITVLMGALDFLGPWYLPAVGMFCVGIVNQTGWVTSRWVASSWAVYGGPVVAGWVGVRNPSLVAAMADLFSLPWPWLVWIFPVVIFGGLGWLSFSLGESVSRLQSPRFGGRTLLSKIRVGGIRG